MHALPAPFSVHVSDVAGDAPALMDRVLAFLSSAALVGGLSLAMLMLLATPGQPLDSLFALSKCMSAG